MSDKLAGSLQENLLTLLISSPSAASLIRNSVEPELFSSELYRTAVSRVYDYLDAHKQPPGHHFPELLEDILTRKDNEGKLAERLVVAVLEKVGQVHEPYIISQLDKFTRTQGLKIGLINASGLLQEGREEEAELEIEKALKRRLQLFTPGMDIRSGLARVMAGDVRRDVIPTGIKELDDWELGPGRGELHVFVGLAKRGKSWWLINLAKRALLARKKVAYVTLELSEAQVVQRIIQSLFSIMRRRATVEVSRLEVDDLGRFLRFEREQIIQRLAFNDPGAKRAIEDRFGRVRFLDNLLVKNFPTRSLSVNGLRAYLDSLERQHNFIPDMICIDYPNLMKVDAKNLRIELGILMQDLRGVAVERDVIMPTVTQSNRAGAEQELVTEANAAEDWSIIGTADTVITYSQTLAEKELALARLFVSNTRVSERDRFVTLIAQGYPIGQFCLDSALMSRNYFSQVKEATGDKKKKERE